MGSRDDEKERNVERAQIAEAASLTGSPWLAYMARYAEPAMTPSAWDEAVLRAQHEIRLYGDPTIPPGSTSPQEVHGG